jgi:hypothetical protein
MVYIKWIHLHRKGIEMTMIELLNMEMSAEVEHGCFRIKRVPGGWVYTRLFGSDAGISVHSVYVPEPAGVLVYDVNARKKITKKPMPEFTKLDIKA